ncbi:MAG: hypothetical protein WBL23_06270 [Salinisphaera sp.]|uniref:class I SAM-dependent methyltransferase n=1 Tax=Salinisphaera sp. TaxID=1914330 RepID=UPI003C7AEC4F
MSGASPGAGSHFADDWLLLREAVDHRSRAHGLAALAARHLRRKSGGRPARVIDLGAGRGSNLRYLVPRLGRPIEWQLIDQDAGLLATAVRTTPLDDADAGRLTTEIVNLAAPLSPVLAGADLVTASALLDLVSRRWIENLVDACTRAGAAVLIAVSVDGRVRFSDHDADDDLVCWAVARDQARDKGFGPALGGTAPAVLINALARRGYAVTAQQSDWHVEAGDARLARALIEGWRDAATCQRPDRADCIARWADRRSEDVDQGRTRLRVGHIDVLGLPHRVSPR